MRKHVFIALMLLAVISVSAQEKGKVRLGFNGGLALPHYGVGPNVDVDARYNFTDNFNAGVKLGLGFMVKDIDRIDYQTYEMTTMLYSNFLVHGSYYFAKGFSHFAPFVGGGLGSFNVLNMYATALEGTNTEYELNSMPEFDKVFGGMLSAGFEIWKFRVAAEYYMVNPSNRYDLNTESFNGMSNNNFLNLSVGFYFGGGSWKKTGLGMGRNR